ncbi:hypothetical protein L6164_016020 [Bauhinia variegata]|uniref:Uncharacterized protein n=1 Tax=Bauhinia variegata TaxID=167791 RepID=A0ACB9NNS1_BAUVA|nr:hypothetical protein L6164_016020 [Bauhinia variegata]
MALKVPASKVSEIAIAIGSIGRGLRGSSFLLLWGTTEGGMVVDSHTGEVVMRLRGLRDYAFATGNEEKTCSVWVGSGVLCRRSRWLTSKMLRCPNSSIRNYL